MTNENDIVIVSAFRTPIGSFNGSLSSFKAHELGTFVLQRILDETNKTIPDEVIIGQALTASQGQNPARQTALNSDLPNSITATTINMLCGSGLKACVLGVQSIKCGDNKVVICGGQESMSQAPHCIHLRNGHKMNDATLTDSMITDGLTDAFHHVHMGNTAEYVAKVYSVSREDQDKYALDSQLKYAKALKNANFQNEIVPIKLKVKNEVRIIETDEFPRPNTSLEGLSRLKPCFAENGTITAGNASGINDGAALVMITTYQEAKSRGLSPLVRVVSYAQCGDEPLLMGVVPIQTIKQAVSKAGWSLDDVDLFEINEAFSSQCVAILRELKLDESKVNINGGSIALGHPIGASGARILVTLIHSLIRENKTKGVAALCIGGGMSIAMCVERYNE